MGIFAKFSTLVGGASISPTEKGLALGWGAKVCVVYNFSNTYILWYSKLLLLNKK